MIRPVNTSTVPHPFRRLYREMGGRAITLFEGRINNAANASNEDQGQAMSLMLLYPLRFRRIYKDRLYGLDPDHSEKGRASGSFHLRLWEVPGG
jgi:hypothetical protein